MGIPAMPARLEGGAVFHLSDGEIWNRSAGSEFWLELPRTKEKGAAKAAPITNARTPGKN